MMQAAARSPLLQHAVVNPSHSSALHLTWCMLCDAAG